MCDTTDENTDEAEKAKPRHHIKGERGSPILQRKPNEEFNLSSLLGSINPNQLLDTPRVDFDINCTSDGSENGMEQDPPPLWMGSRKKDPKAADEYRLFVLQKSLNSGHVDEYILLPSYRGQKEVHSMLCGRMRSGETDFVHLRFTNTPRPSTLTQHYEQPPGATPRGGGTPSPPRSS